MKRNTAILLFLFFVITKSAIVSGQKADRYFFNTFIFGSSLTVMDVGAYEQVYLMNWNMNAATSLGKRFFAGIQVQNIFLKNHYFGTKLYRISGLFTQFSVAPYSRFRPFVELSYNTGDYYYSGYPFLPDDNLDLYYIGIGGGADIPLSFLSKHLFIDVSFVFFYVEDMGQPDDFNQYIVGLNYRFGKMVSVPFTKY